MFAPIILFVYNRPEHTRNLLESLNRNPEAKESDLYVFCDGPKPDASEEMRARIAQTRAVVRETAKCRSLTMQEAEVNKGLAPSVIAGVGTVLAQHECAIVLEDDLLLSEYFLKYMNDALRVYWDNPKVACISGYVCPHKKKLPETFFLRGADCWGWATWKRAWNIFEPDGQLLMNRLKNSNRQRHLCFQNTYDYVTMLQNQIDGKNSSWAIRWLISAYLADMYCLYPDRPLDVNDGFDGSGTHCTDNKKEIWAATQSPVQVAVQPVTECRAGYRAYCRHYAIYGMQGFLSRRKQNIQDLFQKWMPSCSRK